MNYSKNEEPGKPTMILDFGEFNRLVETKHYGPMKDNRVSTRSGRRSYIEEQLTRLGYNYTVDINPEPDNTKEPTEKTGEVESSSIPSDIESIHDDMFGPMGLIPRFRDSILGKYKRYKSSNEEEFENFCKTYYRSASKDLSKEDLEWAREDFEFERMMRRPFVMNYYKSSYTPMKENIVVFANGFDINRPTRVLMAHYDVNTESDAHDNANDNGASIIVLLEYLEDKNFPSDKNILVVFTDGEEFGGQGAKEFANQVKEGNHGNVEWVLNLDVVGIGDKVVFEYDSSKNIRDHIISVLGENTGFIKMPFNDAQKLRTHNINAACLSVIPQENWDSENNTMIKQPGMWSNLHRTSDSWDSISNETLLIAYKAVQDIMNS